MRPGRTPKPAEIREAREKAGLERADAARMIYKSAKAWEKWELGERAMDPAFWEFWLLKMRDLDRQRREAQDL